MNVGTLGQAWKLGWRIRAKCLRFRPAKGSERPMVWCDWAVELDMLTLVWTRGEGMPLDLLHERLRCPRCGNRDIQVLFEVPNEPNARAANLPGRK